MISQEAAEELAQQAMQDYIALCMCDTPQDVANALMKLTSMCGLGMCAVVGQQEAVTRLEGTAAYIATTQAGKHWKSAAVN